MAQKVVYDKDFIHITADQDEFIELNQNLMELKDEESSSEDEKSNDALVIEEDEPSVQDSNGTQGDFAVLMAAIETCTAQEGDPSGDSCSPQIESAVHNREDVPVAQANGLFAQHVDNLELSAHVQTILSPESVEYNEEVSQVSRLIHFPRQDIVFQAYSPPSVPGVRTSHGDRCNHTLPDLFWLDMTEVACTLLNSAAAQLEPPVHVDEETVRCIAQGLYTAMDFTTEMESPLIGRRGIGRLVAAIILDRQTGILLAYAVAQLVPQALIDGSTGNVVGMMLHQVTRGFGINDNCRRIITENTGSVLLVVNQIPN
ncbi:uncharacterized protein LOC108040910 [Drosophila rhopaloa]|uniref:Uncharacterized protein n=1 Tax=Drosophila rhopaloa TaxID=1041015 RepID=A0ABM5H3V8_DRORH|nr:uncharacterized protein LOC108040910 [Drosophila rhopaloa]